MCVSLSVCGPVMDWQSVQSVQGGPRLHPTVAGIGSKDPRGPAQNWEGIESREMDALKENISMDFINRKYML